MFKRTSANYGSDGEEMVGPEEATPWHVLQSSGGNIGMVNIPNTRTLWFFIREN